MVALLAVGAWAQTWPLANASHDVLHSYQNPFAFDSYFHEGVDLRGELDDVVAIRSGTVVYVEPFDSGGTVVVRVDDGSGEADSYLHLHIGPWRPGDTIEAGDVIGQVSDSYFTQDNQHHLHVNRFATYIAGNGYVADRSNMRHPLALFADDLDRDPQLTPAEPADANEDGAVFRVVDADDDTAVRDPAWGEVDLLLEATDRLTNTLYWSQGLVSVGYYITSLARGPEVLDAGNPYTLVRFDDAWRSSCGGDCDDLVSQVMASRPSDVVAFGPDDTYWTSLATYTLTHTRGTTGAGARVDGAERWKTDARAGTTARPNGSDGAGARLNDEAAFPDGAYTVYAVTEDLVHRTDTPFPVLVDNFRPYVAGVRAWRADSGEILHDRSWTLDPVARALVLVDHRPPGPGSRSYEQDIVLEVTFSEPMATARLRGTLPDLWGPIALHAVGPSGATTTFTATLEAREPPFAAGGRGLVTLAIAGTDLAGHTVVPLADPDPVAVPFARRPDITGWDDPSDDRVHRIPLGR